MQARNDTWILDSGVSDHMSFDVSGLHDLQLLDNPVSVSLPNGYKVQVTHSRKLKINDNLTLNHVLLVSHFKYNLLSIKRLASQLYYSVTFSKELCILQGLSLIHI